MKNYSKVTPEGTRDLLFEECAAQTKIEDSLSRLFLDYGYEKVYTPTIEFYDVFAGEHSGLSLEFLYKLTDNRCRLLVMRPDSTMPIARLTATRLKDVFLPIRLYYSQDVFKVSPKLTGRRDEIKQAGIELIGASGLRADLEVIILAIESLKRSGAPDYRLEISHVGIFNSLIDEINADEDLKDELCDLVSSKNYMALDERLNSLGDNQILDSIRMLPRLFGGSEILDEAKKHIKVPGAADALNYLCLLYNALEELRLKDKISIDLGQLKNNNYYTGIVFRGYMAGSGVTVLSGGRYDSLIKKFGLDLPATGFGVEVDALASALLQRGEVEFIKAPDALVFAGEGQEIDSLTHMTTLHSQGITCENSLFDTVEKTIEYAKRKGIKRVDVVKTNGSIEIVRPEEREI